MRLLFFRHLHPSSSCRPFCSSGKLENMTKIFAGLVASSVCAASPAAMKRRSVNACSLLLLILLQASGLSYSCESIYTSGSTGPSGNFSSPGYPLQYSMNTNCRYIFQGTPDERINITFLDFDLESGTDAGCLFDYIDIFTIDTDLMKNLEDRLCGRKIPRPIISIHQRLELVFKSDYAGTRKGFFGVYMFIDENWQPFPANTDGCGDEIVRGVGGEIRSPGYPNTFPPNSKCTWMIRGEDNTKIILNYVSLNLGQSAHCGETFVAIYNGFANSEGHPAKKLCKEASNEKEFISKTFRVVIRFMSGSEGENLRDGGFRIVWTAVKIPQENSIRSGAYVGEQNCNEFHCKGGEYCIDTSGLLCNPLPRYCIAKSLRCNSVPNCGAYDQSDEEGCFSTAFVISGGCGGAVLLFALLATSVIVYRKRSAARTKKRQSMIKIDGGGGGGVGAGGGSVIGDPINRQPTQLDCLDRSPSMKRRASSVSLQATTASRSAAPYGPRSSVNYGATTSYRFSTSSDASTTSAAPSTGIYRRGSLTRSEVRRIRSGAMMEVAYQPLKPRDSPQTLSRPRTGYDGGGGTKGLDDGQQRPQTGGASRTIVGRTTYLVRCPEPSVSPGTSSAGDTDSYSYVDLDPGSRTGSVDVGSPVALLGPTKRWVGGARYTIMSATSSVHHHNHRPSSSSVV